MTKPQTTPVQKTQGRALHPALCSAISSCWRWTAFLAGSELNRYTRPGHQGQNCPYLQCLDFISTSGKKSNSKSAFSVFCFSLWNRGEAASNHLLKRLIKAKVFNQRVNRLPEIHRRCKKAYLKSAGLSSLYKVMHLQGSFRSLQFREEKKAGGS